MTKAVEYFDRASSSWADHYAKGGSMSPRVARFLEQVRRHCQPGSVGIDFGCGTGEITHAIYRAGYKIRGFDAAAGMIRHASERFGDGGALTFQHLPAGANLPVIDADFAIASSVFEYLEDVDHAFSTIRAALKLGGFMFITVPGKRRLETLLRPLAGFRVVNALMPSRIRNYLDYLATSRNRWPLERWQAAADGFRFVAAEGQDQPLAMLVFRVE